MEKSNKDVGCLIVLVLGIAFLALLSWVSSDPDPIDDSNYSVPPVQIAPADTPDWYGKKYIVTTIDKQEGMEDYDIGAANVWSSPASPTNNELRSVVFQLYNDDEVFLIGYKEDIDYCEIRKDGESGWFACGWLLGLPNHMVDSWD